MAKKKRTKKTYTKSNLTAKQSANLKKLPKPKLSYAEYQKRTGKQSRRQYNNYRAKQAGFKDYATWQKARKEIGVRTGSKAPKGKKKPKVDKFGGKAYKFDWKDGNQEENEKRLKELLDSQPNGKGAQFVVLANGYPSEAVTLKEFRHYSTFSFPVHGSNGWENRTGGRGMVEYLRDEFHIIPFHGTRQNNYTNGIKTVWVYIQDQKQ